MSTIVTRAGKGSPLTSTEVDSNFTNLNTDKVEKSGSTLTGDLAFGDNVKAKFGASNDLEIYHDGSNTRIREVGTGSLLLDADSLYLRNTSGDSYVQGINGGAVNIFYNGAVKLNTTSTGIDVTGTLVADKFEATSTSFLESTNLQLSAGFPRLILLENDTTNLNSRISHQNGALRIETLNDAGTTGTKRLDIDHSTGDISFYDDAGTSQDFYWDASTSRLGLGTTSPANLLHINAGTAETTALFESTDNTARIQIKDNGGFANIAVGNGNLFLQADQGNAQSGSKIEFDIDGSEVARFNSSGRLGIGTTNPSTPLDVSSSSGGGSEDIQTWTYAGTTTYNLKLRQVVSSGLVQYRFDLLNNGTSYDNNLVLDRGNVGIGTTSPSAALHIINSGLSDQLRVSNTTSDSTIKYGAVVGSHYNNSEEPIAGILLTSSSSSTGGSVDIGGGISACNAVNTIKFYTASNNTTLTGSERMRIDSNGRLGIGTTSPSQLVHLNGGVIRVQQTNYADYKSNQLYVNSGGYEFAVNGNIEFSDQSNNTVMIVDNANDRVGIGTTSPNRVFHVEGTKQSFGSTNSVLQLADDTAMAANVGGGLTFTGKASTGQSDSNTVFGAIHAAKDNSTSGNTSGHMIFSTRSNGSNPAERMRIDSSGSFLVGKTAAGVANEGFEVNSNNYVAISKTSFSPLILNRKSTDGTIVDLRINNNTIGSIGNSGTLTYLDGNTGLIFKEGGTEAARIDSSGNLLVGTTDSSLYNNTSGNGVGLIGGNRLEIARSGGPTAHFNRMSSDGSIVIFRKDGTTVGSIGVDNSDNLVIEGNSTHSGLQFGTATIMPHQNGAVIDNTVDLGYFSHRFKDLYLSGGVYLGGTGNANLLDDYEEGNFTPVLADASSGGNESATTLIGKYIKIGSLVYVDIIGTNTDTTGLTAGNSAVITGLPFTVQATGGVNPSCSVWANQFTFTDTLLFSAIQGTTYGNFINVRSGLNTSNVVISDIADDVADFKLSLTYRTTS